jgi:uncharacterized membrane protein
MADNAPLGLDVFFSPAAVTGGVSLLLIGAGIVALRSLKENSPLSPYVLQILGLTFILPVVLLVSLILKVSSESVMGLLGTIVGYIFGSSRVTEQSISQARTAKNDQDS